MNTGDKVMMISNDGFGKKGWSGVVSERCTGGESVVRVIWDNGRNYLHEITCLKILGQSNDPNVGFLIKKNG